MPTHMIFTRLYLYGWMLGLSFPASAMLDSHLGIVFPLPFTLSGIGMLLIRAVLLIRFLRDYPLPTEDTHSEGAFDGTLL